MDWSNERYVRVYVRETIDDISLSWEARAIWAELIKRFDRAGVIALGRQGVNWTKGLAALIRIPLNVVEDHFHELLEDGRVEIREEDGQAWAVAPNFIEAQEAKQSDSHRQREYRARRREKALAGQLMMKVGIVYVIRRPDGAIKIGFTAGDVDDRMQQISLSAGVQMTFVTACDGTPQMESELRRLLEPHRLIGEWFAGDLEVIGIINDYIRNASVTPEDDNRNEHPDPELRSVTPSLAVPCLAVPDLFCSSEGDEQHNGFDLEAIYKAYPRKTGKKQGLEKLRKVIKTASQYEVVLAAAKRWGETWKGKNKKFCPYFSTFVNRESWRDEELPTPDEEGRDGYAEPSSEGDYREEDDIDF